MEGLLSWALTGAPEHPEELGVTPGRPNAPCPGEPWPISPGRCGRRHLPSDPR